MHYLFCDTNIFIHFVYVDEIDWASEIGTSGEIVINLAPVVMDELDKHKYNRNPKISNRVRSLLPKIENAIENPGPLKYKFLYIAKRPTQNFFTDNQLDRSQADDNLLATIIEFRQQIQPEDEIIYVTNDVGPRLKARSLGIKTLKPNKKYLLTVEPNKTERENAVLSKELQALKNNAPVINLTFVNKKKLMGYKRQVTKYTKESFIEEQFEKVKIETPILLYIDPDTVPDNHLTKFVAGNKFFALSQQQVDSYNQDLVEHYRKYKQYASSLFEVLDFRSHCIKIELSLVNSGTAPATDIDVEMHFPDGFELITKKELPKTPKKPEPPYKPKNRFDLNLNIGGLSSVYFSGTSAGSPGKDLNDPSINKTNSYNVSYHFHSLKQTQQIELKPLYAKFDDLTKAKGFAINYKIIVANLAEPVTGILHIKFDNPENV